MRTGPTNPRMVKLIEELEHKAHEHDAPIWKRLAHDLGKPTRIRRAVNLYKINEFTKDNETVVIPGKVLSVGELDHNVTVAAFAFSQSALDKINKVGKAISIFDLIKESPKGKKIKILG